ncbi:DUF6801 domain-containing protein [Actinokineospora iranica]|uniref:DUF6801 domain-containing protein n=1 Tax=Actinokineospora iranica TaxID=1271860 RepID=A0A1G6WLN7_9PSEU|nr:DUF6801 domain-containing protein [Actinokineospora iranica]SDD66699.1 hypothetical protein SAMN05216174_11570 [Actinokineospora iranica]
MSGITRWIGVSAVVAATAAVLAVPASAHSAAPPVPGPQKVVRPLALNCQHPLLVLDEVVAEITATFPGRVAVGEPIRTTGFGVAVTLDRAVVTGLALVGAATVEGTAVAGVDLDVNGTEIGIALPGLTFPATPVAPHQTADLAITGPVPAFTVKRPGVVRIGIGDGVTVTVTPRRADGTLTGLGVFDVPCRVAPGQDLAMATIPVT